MDDVVTTQQIYEPVEDPNAIYYLALGDSYTIGQSVTYNQNFPSQLKDSLEKNITLPITTEIIAVTGWRTDNLINAINKGTQRKKYDFVTLLIGVNNQYQNRPFIQYENEFPELLKQAVAFAKGNTKKVIVVSIPDYAYTPFGQNSNHPETISSEIDAYNAFAKKISESFGVSFVNITDITRKGLENPNLVASDGLHPSAEAYKKFVERIYTIALAIVK
tara:strand:- start:6162 stop:6818 length:657 start_codon:yes stop_codon:yes gene_type:complete